ncbi:MAG: glycosyltransferase family 2 protein [Acidobacteriota bacterium]|jgi:glycosyltransferase involved in cell wall biosynthesis
MSHRTLVVMPAYNAAETLETTLSKLPDGCCDEVLVVDDASRDDTAEIAARLPVTLIRHERNLGYGGNQKTCYREALARGADHVVMVHPDDQYDARLVPAAVEILRLGVLDLVLGNRIRTRREALSGGMPRIKYLANRGLTILENVLTGQNLGEWHSGFRAYDRRLLETIPFERNSDDFVFDSQLLLQAVHFGFRLGDIPMPVRYFDEASSIGLRRASSYALATLGSLGAWYAHRWKLRRSPLFSPPADALDAATTAQGD